MQNNEILDRAIDVFGYDGTKQIFGELFASVDFSNDYLKPVEDLKGVQLVIGEPGNNDHLFPVIGTFTGWNSIGLYIDSGHPPQVIRDTLQKTVLHEATHMTCWQRGVRERGLTPEGELRRTLIERTIDEGIAVFVESTVFGEEAVVHEYGFSLNPRAVKNAIRDISGNIRPATDVEHVDFMVGKKRGKRKRIGYAVGYSIVKQAMKETGMSVDKLVRTDPLDIWSMVV